MEQVKRLAKDALLQARERGLSELRSGAEMKAHGKVAGMDTFSWENPEVDALGSMMCSLPFDVIWVASFDQVNELANEMPEALLKLDTILLYDHVHRSSDLDWISQVKNVAFVGGVANALQFMHALKKNSCAFLFTSNSKKWGEGQAQFERFLKAFGG